MGGPQLQQWGRDRDEVSEATTAMSATLAKIKFIVVEPDWLLLIGALLAALIVSALIFWRALKKRE